MSTSGHAIFLSYASQDAPAVLRICEALRAAGLEVWFDQAELAGGDAWDQKIRGQIKSCALFIPVISARTNERREGYFRREWKIAVDRTHDMDEGLPFLVPVVIDGTTDAAAFVPEKFREVQWTRLPGGETPPAFCSRVKALLDGETPLVASRAAPKSNPVASHLAVKRRLPVWAWVLIALPGFAILYFSFNPRRPARAINPPIGVQIPTENAAVKTTPAAPLSSEAGQLTARAYALTQKLSFTPEELGIAEELSQRATELEPQSARAWSVRSWVQGSYLMRNWDYSQKRMEDVQTFAKRALSLGDDDADAINALAQVMEKQSAFQEQEKLARRAIAADPTNARSRITLARALMRLSRTEEARGVLREAIAQNPDEPLRHYELANTYLGFGFGLQVPNKSDVEMALSELDAALARQPFASAMLAKAVILASRKNDLPGMRRQLDDLEKLSLADRSAERAVFVAMQGALWERNPERVFAAAALTAQTYFGDGTIQGPKAWLIALAYRIDGKENSARREWQSAETVLRQKLRDDPNDPYLHGQLAATLAWLGRDEEADREMRPIESLVREQQDFRNFEPVARYYAARGDAAKALPYLRLALGRSSFLTQSLLRIDPWWDKLRGQPLFDDVVNAPVADETIAKSAMHPTPPVGSSDSTATIENFPTNPQLRRAVEILDANETIAADLGVAEDLVKAILANNHTDVAATLIMGRIQTYYLVRGFDRSEERFAQAREIAERGLTLAPKDPEALSNMGVYLFRRHTELPRAAKLLRQAIELRPQESRYYRMLDNILSTTEGVTHDEIIASARRTAEKFPTNGLAQYELARHYRDTANLDLTLHYLDRAIELGPVANAQIARAELKLSVLGDGTEMAKLDDTLPDRYRSSDRAVYAQFIFACATRNFDQGLTAMQRSPQPWMIDFDFTGPTSLLKGELLLLQNKPELAQLKFTEARAESARHLVDVERNFPTVWLEPWILMRLGKAEEARARNHAVFAEIPRPFRIYLGTNWWFSPIPMNLLLGEREQALGLIREAVKFQYGAQVIRQALTMDPRMAPWKDDAEIKKILAESDSSGAKLE